MILNLLGTKNLGSTDTNIGMLMDTGTTQKYEQFLKTYDMKRLIQHQYGTGITKLRHVYDILNEISILPS